MENSPSSYKRDMRAGGREAGLPQWLRSILKVLNARQGSKHRNDDVINLVIITV